MDVRWGGQGPEGTIDDSKSSRSVHHGGAGENSRGESGRGGEVRLDV